MYFYCEYCGKGHTSRSSVMECCKELRNMIIEEKKLNEYQIDKFIKDGQTMFTKNIRIPNLVDG